MSGALRAAVRERQAAEARPRFEHPAIQEMIARRSAGNADYVAGVRAFLNAETAPANGTMAHNGYLDAHDMAAHLASVRADLHADAVKQALHLGLTALARSVEFRPVPPGPQVQRPSL